MMPIKTYKKIKTIVLYFVVKKNLEISFQNGPEHETTSLKTSNSPQEFHYLIIQLQLPIVEKTNPVSPRKEEASSAVTPKYKFSLL